MAATINECSAGSAVAVCAFRTYVRGMDDRDYVCLRFSPGGDDVHVRRCAARAIAELVLGAWMPPAGSRRHGRMNGVIAYVAKRVEVLSDDEVIRELATLDENGNPDSEMVMRFAGMEAGLAAKIASELRPTQSVTACRREKDGRWSYTVAGTKQSVEYITESHQYATN